MTTITDRSTMSTQPRESLTRWGHVALAALQADLDRQNAHQRRNVKHYDGVPDGDARKPDVVAAMNRTSDRIVILERQINEVFELAERHQRERNKYNSITYDPTGAML